MKKLLYSVISLLFVLAMITAFAEPAVVPIADDIEYAYDEFPLEREGIALHLDRIAVAGTATSIVSMREEMEVYDSTRVHGAVVTRADLDALIAKLQDMPLVDRQKIVGLNPQRAPVILAGIVILQQIMEVTGIDEFTVSESDILQGVVLATASR